MWNLPIHHSQPLSSSLLRRENALKSFCLSYTTKGGHDLDHLDHDHGNGSDTTTTPKDFLIWKLLIGAFTRTFFSDTFARHTPARHAFGVACRNVGRSALLLAGQKIVPVTT